MRRRLLLCARAAADHDGVSLPRLSAHVGERLLAEQPLRVDRFEVVAGEPVLGGLKGATRHFFCSSCMTWLFTRPEGMDDFVNVRSAMFEDAAAHRPYMETHWRDSLPSVQTGAVERFETVPDEDEFGPLIAAYAQWSGATEKERA
jgi:hypothetical protein